MSTISGNYLVGDVSTEDTAQGPRSCPSFGDEFQYPHAGAACTLHSALLLPTEQRSEWLRGSHGIVGWEADQYNRRIAAPKRDEQGRVGSRSVGGPDLFHR